MYLYIRLRVVFVPVDKVKGCCSTCTKGVRLLLYMHTRWKVVVIPVHKVNACCCSCTRRLVVNNEWLLLYLYIKRRFVLYMYLYTCRLVVVVAVQETGSLLYLYIRRRVVAYISELSVHNVILFRYKILEENIRG